MNIMKTLEYVVSITSIFIIAVLTACGGGDTPVPVTEATEEVIEALSKKWTTKSVTLDNVDVTADWSVFTLTFSQTQNYTASVLSSESILVWPAGGSYTFPNTNNAKQILRDDGVQITISNITETAATLTFSITGRNGRTDGLIGEWVFEMGS